MKPNKFIKYIFINIVFCHTWINTEFGICKMVMDSSSVQQKSYIQESIINLADSLIIKYGPIEKKQFIMKFDNQSIKELPSWSHGITKKHSDTIIMFTPYNSNISKNRFKQVLKHELMHLYLNRKNTNSIFIPRWFKEGLSMHEADEFSMSRKIILAQGYWQDQLHTLSQLKSFHRLGPNQIKLAYSQSIAALIAMQYLFKFDIDNKFLNELQNVNKFEDFFYNLTNITTDQFETLYLKFIEDHYKWFILLKITNFFMILFPILLTIGYIVKLRYGKKKYLEWEIEEMIEDIDWKNSADG